MKKSPVKNITSYRVIYGDTDQMGVVYYANYLRWFEQGRSEFLRQIGLPYSIIEQQGFHFPVVEASCRYVESAATMNLFKSKPNCASAGALRLRSNMSSGATAIDRQSQAG
jgi:acyl-CoA thioesterase FadM